MATEGQPGQPRPLQMGAKGAYIVRLLMVGDSSCGKTSLVLRFDQNVFSTKFVTTIGVDYRDKMVKVRYGRVDFYCVPGKSETC
jgi:Ras-related protein Rab-8A